MNMTLPPLRWVESPNFSARIGGTKPDLIVIHDCEGGYQGSIATFLQTAPRQVSAHLVLREDGGEATQMVGFAAKAWHACAFNSRSIGIEMAGFEAKGFAVAEWQSAAVITAYLCHRYGIPVEWSRDGRAPGICRHLDLGVAGGGHVDPTQDAATWTHFLDLVDEAARTLGLPPEPWGLDIAPGRAIIPALAQTAAAVVKKTMLVAAAHPQRVPLEVGDISGLQAALNSLGVGASPALDVDGNLGIRTKQAVMAFQTRAGLPQDGVPGRLTMDAINAELAKQ